MVDETVMVPLGTVKLMIKSIIPDLTRRPFMPPSLTITEQEELDEWITTSDENMSVFDDVLNTIYPLLAEDES